MCEAGPKQRGCLSDRDRRCIFRPPPDTMVPRKTPTGLIDQMRSEVNQTGVICLHKAAIIAAVVAAIYAGRAG